MSYEDKRKIINEAYFAENGALTATLRRANLKDMSITMDDVKKYRRENFNEEKRPTEYNTWVGKEPKEEYHADLFFLGKNSIPRLLLVDTFSKRMSVVPLGGKKHPDIIEGLKIGFEEMGGEPKSIYTDAEGAITSNEVKKWLIQQGPEIKPKSKDPVSEKGEDVEVKGEGKKRTQKPKETDLKPKGKKGKLVETKLLAIEDKPAVEDNPKREGIISNITMTHAPLAEAMIKYGKEQIAKRLTLMRMSPEEMASFDMNKLIEKIELEYNTLHAPRAIGMTPMEAEDPKNRAAVKMRLELGRRNENPLPSLHVGSKARAMRKKRNFEKGTTAHYNEEVHNVSDVVQSRPSGQTQYVVDVKPTDKDYKYFKHDRYNRTELQYVK